MPETGVIIQAEGVAEKTAQPSGNLSQILRQFFEFTQTLKQSLKLLTGIILMIYVIYHIYSCAITASQLDIIPFMAGCTGIVILGFGLAALYEYFAGKKRNHQSSGPVIRPLLEGAILAAVIIIICCIINASSL